MGAFQLPLSPSLCSNCHAGQNTQTAPNRGSYSAKGCHPPGIMRRLALTLQLHLLVHVLALVGGAAAGVLRAAMTLSLPTATSTPTPTPTTLASRWQIAVAAAATAIATTSSSSTAQGGFTTNSRILACWATMEQLGGHGTGLMHATPSTPAALEPHLATQPPGSRCTTRLPQSVSSEYADFTSACWRWIATISSSWAKFATECPEFVGTRPFIRGDWDVTVPGYCPTTATVFWTADKGPTYLEAVATPTGIGHLIGVRPPTPTPTPANSTIVRMSGAAPRISSSINSSRGLLGFLAVTGSTVASINFLSLL